MEESKLERDRRIRREYYWKNREKVRKQQQEYYHQKGKEWNRERTKKYRDANRERVREKQKIYKERHKQKKLAEKIAIEKEKRRNYYEKHKFDICNRTLNIYSIRAMNKIKNICPDRVNYYFCKYTFEKYGERYIRYELFLKGINPSKSYYDDCYDAGSLAYMYSIHRCSFMEYENVSAYIKKMIKIYINCALVVYFETRNICKTNMLREVNVNDDNNLNRI